MTATVLTLVLLAVPREQLGDPGQDLVVNVDPCVGVDHVTVRNLVDLELNDTRTPPRPVPVTVDVRCVAAAQEIRIEPWASTTPDGIRAVELVAGDAGTPVAREARARELALAIAELIRRLSIRHPLSAPRPGEAPPAATPVMVRAALPPAEPKHTWQVAVSSTFESFAGGQRMAGADLAVGAVLRSWLLGEVRVGARVVDGGTTAVARLAGRAGSAALAFGLNVWARDRPVGFAMLLRAQGFAIAYDAQPTLGGDSRTALLGALTMAVEPRVLVALSRRLYLAAGGSVGFPIRGVVVRAQGVPADSLTGFAVSATVGAFLRF